MVRKDVRNFCEMKKKELTITFFRSHSFLYIYYIHYCRCVYPVVRTRTVMKISPGTRHKLDLSEAVLNTQIYHFIYLF